jgi:hypothetical protein
MIRSNRCLAAAIGLFFVAPLVAEYLLGDFPITFLSPLIMMAPLYGGGAILIRELTRRTGRSWPTILLLGAAYALIEEGFTTQSLFNPHYLNLPFHLLAPAWIPALGIGGWWTLFMLNVHTFWSIGVSIALIEGLVPSRAKTPWLGSIGASIAALLFLLGAVGTSYTIHHDSFMASHAQFAVTAIVVILFICAAFLIPFPRIHNRSGFVPSPWLTGAGTFLLGLMIMKMPPTFNWGAVAAMLLIDAVFLISIGQLSRRAQWTALHTLSIGAGGAIAYGVNAFFQPPVVGQASRTVVLTGHIVLLAAAIALIAVAATRTRAWIRAANTPATEAVSQ